MTARRLLAASALCGALLVGGAAALDPSEMLADRALEARARAISAQVRCVVCQNQSIDDSSAEIARDMRQAIRERLTKGDADDQVLTYLRSRYGDYVLLKPPFDGRTWLMWLGGPLALAVAAGLLWRRGRSGGGAAPPAPAALSDEERRRVDALLKDGGGAP